MKKYIVAAGALFLSSTVGASPLFAQDMSTDKPSVEKVGDTVWPVCRPGPGDDRCIQAYERGVKESYDQWAMGGSDTGMGGPFEPVDEKTLKGSTMTGSTDAMWTGAKDSSLPAMDVAMSDSGTTVKAPMMSHPEMTAEAEQAKPDWGKFGKK